MTGLQINSFELFIKSCLSPWESAAVFDSKNQLLGLKYETLSDVGSLPQALTIVQQYLRVQPGDLVILNDPFSGGNLLSNMTLVYGMEKDCEGLTLVVRTGFRAKLHLGERVDEEGLRIPPTPLAQKGEWLEPLLLAITSHELAPSGLESRLRTLFQQMRRLSSNLSAPSDAECEHYLKTQKQYFLQLLSEIPNGDVRVEKTLSTGETLRLRLQIQSQQAEFDFVGSSSSQKISLTDSTVHGACIAALLAFYRQQLPLTQSLWELTPVVSPLGSLVNAKYPSSTFRGMTEGLHCIANLVWQALAELAAEPPLEGDSPSPTWLSLEFENSQTFFDCVPSGINAHILQDGESALSLWIRSPIVNSIEQIETLFPLRILSASPRFGSGGLGETKGGDGFIKIYQITKPAKLQWLQHITDTSKVEKTSKNLKINVKNKGESSQIFILKKSGEKINLNQTSGEIHLEIQDQIHILTEGGTGYGKILPPA